MRTRFPLLGALLPAWPHVIILIALTAACSAISARQAYAADYQLIAVGNGRPGIDCVVAGANTTIDSVAAGDDVLIGGLQVITTGPNGICETPLGGDDQRSTNGVVFGGG